jgi:hypothetical protein
MIAFKDKNDGYYQFDWDGVSALPEWTKDMTQIDVVTAYPSIADQLDTIYHEGLDAWKATILAVKEEFPK